ncbi:MAG: sulfite exporter TauE/SafE family protein [Ectothiorhodospiraceae bacterium]|nr:sulfite exporter TauE/SafE family protein [Ectothiorhodospiraceae bacterium]
MTAEGIAAALLVFFLAASIKGVTGLGFSTVALPLLAIFLEPRTAVPLAILPSLSSNVMVMVQAGGFGAALRRFWPLYLAALPGLAIGVQALRADDASLSRGALGIVLVLYAGWALRTRALRIPEALERTLRIPVGFLTGLVNGATGSQVMPVLPYMLSLGLGKDALVQSTNISFTLSSLLMLSLLGGFGLVSWTIVAVGVAGVVPVALGIRLGGAVRGRLPESTFRTAVLLFLMLLGLGLASTFL